VRLSPRALSPAGGNRLASAGDLRPYDLAKPVGGYQKAEPEVMQSADEFIATIFATQLDKTGQDGAVQDQRSESELGPKTLTIRY
jgi:hypothetical protein